MTRTAKSVKVEVTAEDIRVGVRRNCELCPMAVALRRHFPQATRVEVDDVVEGIHIDDVRYNHTDKSLEFILQFDKGATVKPATFTLRTGGLS